MKKSYFKKINLLPILYLFILINNKQITYGQNNWLHLLNNGNQCFNFVDIGKASISGNQLTIEAIIYSEQNNLNCTQSIFHDIVSKHFDNTDVNYLLRPDHAEITTSKGFFVTKPVSLKERNCHHVAMVYDGTYLRFFLDNNFVDSTAVSGNVIVNDFYTAKIGYSGGQNPNYFTQFWGYIDEVRLWKVARTKTQLIENSFKALSNISTQIGLVAYYDFQYDYNNIQGNSSFNGMVTGEVKLEQIIESCAEFTNFENVLDNNIAFYPNPISSKFKILWRDNFKENTTLEIYNTVGKIMYTANILDNDTTYDLSYLPSGLYIARLKSKNQIIASHKFVLE